MQAKSRIVSVVVLVIIVLLGNGIAPVMKTSAEPFAQEPLPLMGYQIYFSEDNAEASRFDHSDEGLSRLGGLLRELGAELYTLEWRDEIPAEADLIVIAGPLWNLSGDKIARLWLYLNNGGCLLLLADVSGDETYDRLPAGSGLFELLWIDMGIRGRDDIVVKENVAPGINPMPDENLPALSQILSPFMENAYFTTTNINTAHPITTGIDNELAFFMARSLQIGVTSSSSKVMPLVFSDTDFYGETTLPEDPEDELFEYTYDDAVDTELGPLPLAAAVENTEMGTRIVLVGDREFATNGVGLKTSSDYSFDYVFPGNVQFILNAITWLLDTDSVDFSPETSDFSGTSSTDATSD